MDAFDADALIYAAIPGHPLGQQVAALFRGTETGTTVGAGSMLLLPEVLSKPLRDRASGEVRVLAGLLARLDLRPVDRATAELATVLASKYRLQAADATHLATAVNIGADRFITNNQRDLPAAITEVTITYPGKLGSPARCRTRRRARSSSTGGTPGCARRAGSGCCKGSTARAAGFWGPTGRTRRGTRTRAPWPGPSPRPGGPRRRRRRTGCPRARRAA